MSVTILTGSGLLVTPFNTKYHVVAVGKEKHLNQDTPMNY